MSARKSGRKKGDASVLERIVTPMHGHSEEMPLPSTLFCHIFILNSVLERAGNRLTEGHDLTLPQWLALGCIGQEGEAGITHSELGQRLMLSKAPITGVVDRLERAGHVQRATSSLDRRVSRITITHEGHRKWLDVRQMMRAHAESSCVGLSHDEQQTLIDLLGRLLETVAVNDPLLANWHHPDEMARRAAELAVAEAARSASIEPPEIDSNSSLAMTDFPSDKPVKIAPSRSTRRTKKDVARVAITLGFLLLSHLPTVRAQDATPKFDTPVQSPADAAQAPQSTADTPQTRAQDGDATQSTADGAQSTAGTSQSTVETGSAATGADADADAQPPGLGDVRRVASDAAAPLSIIDAIVLALQNNPQRKSAQAALEAARARIGTVRASGGPQVNLSGSATGQRGFGSGGTTSNNGGIPRDGTDGGTGNGNGNFNNTGSEFLGFGTNQSLGVNASLPIYTGGRVKASTRVAQFNAQAQASRVLQTDSELVLNVSLGYLNVLRSAQLLNVADSNLDVSRERRRVAGVRFSAGAAARLEVLRADTTLADASQRRVTAVNSLAQSRANLNTLLGRQPETPLRLESIQALSALTPGQLPDTLTPNPNIAPGLDIPAPTAPAGGAPATAIDGTGGVLGGTAGALPDATAPNVTTPGAILPGAIGGNAANNGTTAPSAGVGGAAGGVSTPGVTAPGATGNTAPGTAAGTTAGGTVLTNPAGGASASQATANAAEVNSTVAAQLGSQVGVLASQTGAQLRTTAGAGRDSLAVTSAQLRAAEASVEVARAQRRPNLDLSVSGFLRNPANFLGRFALTLGLGLAQNLYDSGRISSQVREAQFVVDQLRQQLAGQQLDVSNQIEQSLLALDSAQRRLGSADSAVVSAAEALRASRLGYEAGATTSLEVSDAQSALLAAQTDAVNARFDLAQSQSTLAAAVGIYTPAARAAASAIVAQAGTSNAIRPFGAGAPEIVQPSRKRRKFLGIF